MKMPRVSVGLPVYNGENYLREAVDSILAQSFEDFELIISDNASTDGTEKICRKYAAQDRRIRYYRNCANLGAAKNFNRVFELSSGQYFKWAAHDDVFAPDFLLKCVQVLDNDSSIVLCHTRTKFIDEQGRFIAKGTEKLNVESPYPHERFRDLVLIVHGCFLIFGIMRSEILSKTSLIEGYTASDRILLAELSLYGRFVEIPEYLFSRRNHPMQSIMAYEYRSRIVWFDPSKARKIVFQTWKLLGGYSLAIKHAPLMWRERMQCSITMLKWTRWMWKGLIYDLYEAGMILQKRWRIARESAAHSRAF